MISDLFPINNVIFHFIKKINNEITTEKNIYCLNKQYNNITELYNDIHNTKQFINKDKYNDMFITCSSLNKDYISSDYLSCISYIDNKKIYKLSMYDIVMEYHENLHPNTDRPNLTKNKQETNKQETNKQHLNTDRPKLTKNKQEPNKQIQSLEDILKYLMNNSNNNNQSNKTKQNEKEEIKPKYKVIDLNNLFDLLYKQKIPVDKPILKRKRTNNDDDIIVNSYDQPEDNIFDIIQKKNKSKHLNKKQTEPTLVELLKSVIEDDNKTEQPIKSDTLKELPFNIFDNIIEDKSQNKTTNPYSFLFM